jgi:hypothetical protein
MAQLRRLRVPLPSTCTHWGLSTMRSISRNRLLVALVLLILGVIAIYTQSIDRGLLLTYTGGAKPKESSLLLTTTNQQQQPPFTLAPGELPGYTGWARPEHTLAGYFTVVGSFENVTHAGNDWVVNLQCRDHADCPTAQSLFFVRAYGPAVITGQVVPQKPSPSSSNTPPGSSYQVRFRPMDPGVYHVEVVLAFSNAPAMDTFPLPVQHAPVYYEGYLLPNFPLQLTVTGDTFSKTSNSNSKSNLPFCNTQQLTETITSTPATDRARWRVVDKNNAKGHALRTSNSHSISLVNYQKSYNSLGVTMDYEFTDCQLIPPPVVSDPTPTTTVSSNSNNDNNINPFQCLQDQGQGQPETTTLHVILLGDSVMRLQKEIFEDYIRDSNSKIKIKVSFIELYGGTLRCLNQSGPNVTQVLPSMSQKNERRVVVFNTGMHDIHRLCGSEWASDRQTYLSPQEQSLSCTVLYQQAVQALATAVDQFPAEAKIFQTTTAAWPKYGNYNIAWGPTNGQALPLDPSIVSHFNRIAVETLQKQNTYAQKSKFLIVDGYWITLARPDHRETDQKVHIGKKLSHPGPEVAGAMVRIWTMVLVWTVCPVNS